MSASLVSFLSLLVLGFSKSSVVDCSEVVYLNSQIAHLPPKSTAPRTDPEASKDKSTMVDFCDARLSFSLVYSVVEISEYLWLLPVPLPEDSLIPPTPRSVKVVANTTAGEEPLFSLF